MLQLLGAEALDVRLQRRLVLAQHRGLLGVVVVDRLLHRHRARHRRARAHGGGERAEGEAGDVPQRQQGGRAHAALGDEAGEGVEVHLLLLLHVADRGLVPGAAQHGELALIDALGAILAGVVHADHALEVVARGGAHRVVVSLPGRRASARARAPSATP